MTTTVVGAAVVRQGRVLAARRTRPPELAGRWELPGGKIEPGEKPREALERELFEELDLPVRVGTLIGRTSLGTGRELAVYACEAFGEPLLGDDHDDLSWLTPDELDDLDWVDADRELLPAVIRHLSTQAHTRVARWLLRGAVAAFVLALVGVIVGVLTAQQTRISCGNDIDQLIKLVCTDKTYPHLLSGMLVAVVSALAGSAIGIGCLARRRRYLT